MQRVVGCEITIDIELITLISGANQYFEVLFMSSDKTEYKITFDRVWDMRYSIENASIERWSQLKTCLSDGLEHNSMYLIEDSEYIKYFEQQVLGTRPIDDLKHYILFDNVDTTLDVIIDDYKGKFKPNLVKV